MFKALPPYYGNKRKLCPVIFSQINKRLSREKWQGATFVDGFELAGTVHKVPPQCAKFRRPI